MSTDRAKWSGDGELTAAVVACLEQLDAIAFLRIEDAPASRADATFAFVSNEIYVGFAERERKQRAWRLGLWPTTRTVRERAMSLVDLERVLMESPGIGTPDYADETMLQYLRTERDRKSTRLNSSHT